MSSNNNSNLRGGHGSNQLVGSSSTSGSTGINILSNRKPWSAPLSVFFASLDKYTPTIPDAVVQYHLSKSGVNTKDPRVARMVATAADKFLAEIIFESKQLSELKKRKGKDKRKADEIAECLQLSDLSQVLQSKRISLNRRFKETTEE